jgi:hypothetical protein
MDQLWLATAALYDLV